MAIKKLPPTKKLLMIGLPLIFLQLIFIFLFQSDAPLTQKEAINLATMKNNALPADRKDMVRIQLALSGFMSNNKHFPKTLDELVPDYLDAVPLDPKTGGPFKYKLEGNRYVLGDFSTTTQVAENGKNGPKLGVQAVAGDESSQLLAYLDQDDPNSAFSYDPTGKKDPFRSFDFSPKVADDNDGTPLEQYSYNELRLVAVLEGFGEPKAVVEDPKGKGHTVNVGTKLGNLGGTVMKIEKDKLVILEKSVEFTGETQTRTVEMYIR